MAGPNFSQHLGDSRRPGMPEQDEERRVSSASLASISDGMEYEKRLWLFTRNQREIEPRFLLFRGLNALNINWLQNELAKRKSDMERRESAGTYIEMKALSQLLHTYSLYYFYFSNPLLV
jgi:hypothetical protein